MDQPTPPAKKIVICLDGTSNQIGKSDEPTNVGKVFMMLDLDHPSQQVAYYDPGVGTLPASGATGKIGRWLSIVRQLITGFGMQENVAQAYTWLMDVYRPDDLIYIFGFSRGAYTARGLAAMLGRPGLLRSGSLNLVDYAVREYTHRPPDTGAKDRAHDFADATCWGTPGDPMNPADADMRIGQEDRTHAIPVEFVGVWDTVKAAGLLGFGRNHWPDTHILWNVRRFRHAVSIDERRRPFHEYLLDDTYSSFPASFEEVWFSGVHSDVGGTFEDRPRLSTIALKWVFDAVAGELMLRDGKPAVAYDACRVELSCAQSKIHPNGRAWDLVLGPRSRPVSTSSKLHSSVLLRQDRWGPNLRNLNLDVTSSQWVDPDWTKPIYPLATQPKPDST